MNDVSLGRRGFLRAGLALAVTPVVASCASAAKVVTSDNPLQAAKDVVIKPINTARDLADGHKNYQKALNAKGCEAGKADGVIGDGTKAAHNRLEAANGGNTIPKTAIGVLRAKVGCP